MVSISRCLFTKLMLDLEVGRVDFSNPSRLEEFRRNVSCEQTHLLDSCREGERVPQEHIADYLEQRFMMFDCPMTRSLYKIEMSYAIEEALGMGPALGVIRRALNHLRLTLKDPHLLGYCSLVVACFTESAFSCEVAIDICSSSVRRAEASGVEVHCLPELYRLWAESLFYLDRTSQALQMVRKAELAASRQSYYMPALWNRIHRTKAMVLKELNDEKGAAESLSMVKSNRAVYCAVENSNDVADERLRWMDRRPPDVRPMDAAT